MNTIDTARHILKFNFETITNTQAIDALVYALSIDLLLTNKILCSQPSHNTLEFDSAQHCMLAQLALSSDSRFSVSTVESILD